MSISTIKQKIRFLIEDNSSLVKDIFTYEASAIFDLSETNVISVTIVYKNSSELGSGSYSYDSETNKVTLTTSLIAGDTIEIDYTCYQNYSDSELLSYIQAALVHLSINNFYDYEYDTTSDTIQPEPEIKTENLIALIASIIIKPDNKSIRLPDLSITVPDDLPLNEKISKTIALAKRSNSGIFEVI